MLNKEINKKDNQLNDKNNTISTLNNHLKEKDEKIEELQSILQEIPKQPLDDNKKEEFFKAIENNNIKKVKMFLFAYKDVVSARDKKKKTLFLYAAQNGHLELAKLLRQRGANIYAKDKDGDNALRYAKKSSGSEAMINYFKSLGLSWVLPFKNTLYNL